MIAGKTDPSLWQEDTSSFTGNIIYTGYQSDGRIKALLEESKALIFPSRYEGFGIPPLEALGCGTAAIVSDIQVMREIYGNDVYYIDPDNPRTDPDALLRNRIDNPQRLLNESTWEKQGEKWYRLILRSLL